MAALHVYLDASSYQLIEESPTYTVRMCMIGARSMLTSSTFLFVFTSIKLACHCLAPTVSHILPHATHVCCQSVHACLHVDTIHHKLYQLLVLLHYSLPQ